MELTLGSAFLVGLLGSVHCIGMCGGIVGVLGSTLPDERSGGVNSIPFWLSYNAGRILSYASAGVLAGFLGNAALSLFTPTRVAEIGIVLSASFMIALGLYLAGWWRGLVGIEVLGGFLWRRIEPLARAMLPVTSPFKAFPLGLLWGWLPCGFGLRHCDLVVGDGGSRARWFDHGRLRFRHDADVAFIGSRGKVSR